jgi:hypothetical protein
MHLRAPTSNCLPAAAGGDPDVLRMKDAVAAFIERRGRPRYDGRREILITCCL